MDIFETIAAKYLENNGYWVRRSLKLDISKEEKKALGTQTMPRPEIDLVAYKPCRNELVLFEVKSFLYGPGVTIDPILGKGRYSKRYRLFNNNKFQKCVSKQLVFKLMEEGLISGKVKVRYGLICGNVYKRDSERIEKLFCKKGWVLIKPEDIRQWVRDYSEKGWDDDPVVLTAKLLEPLLKD
ncbi:MAG: hypothetical protein HQL30_03830 [Candidatus Omnitrophica bacterium]|nr:hypothetical protein [Candidatus Omnitrophota bacterium]